MANTVNYGPTPTAVAGIEAIALDIDPINNVDLDLVKDEPGETISTDNTSPVDRPSTLRIATRDVKNVYGSTNIDPTLYLSNKGGRDIVVQCQEVHEVTDATIGASATKQYPIKATLTLNVPAHSAVTAEAMKHMVSRLLGAIARQGEATLDSGLLSLQRGTTRR